jgi:hypothetical protein
VFYLNPHAGPDGRRQANFQAGFQGGENLLELTHERFLVNDRQEVCQAITPEDFGLVVIGDLKEYITGEKRLIKEDGFSAIFMRDAAAGQGGGDLLPFAEANEFLFTSRPCMGNEPKQLGHSSERFKNAPWRAAHHIARRDRQNGWKSGFCQLEGHQSR